MTERAVGRKRNEKVRREQDHCHSMVFEVYTRSPRPVRLYEPIVAAGLITDEEKNDPDARECCGECFHVLRGDLRIIR